MTSGLFKEETALLKRPGNTGEHFVWGWLQRGRLPLIVHLFDMASGANASNG